MLILALAIVVVTLGWLLLKWADRMDPIVRRVGIGCAIACAGVVLTVRGGPAALGLFVVALVALGVWLRLRGRGGEGPDDDGRGPPDGPDPEPDPGDDAEWDPGRLDQDAFDRARAQWEHDLPKRG